MLPSRVSLIRTFYQKQNRAVGDFVGVRLIERIRDIDFTGFDLATLDSFQNAFFFGFGLSLWLVTLTKLRFHTRSSASPLYVSGQITGTICLSLGFRRICWKFRKCPLQRALLVQKLSGLVIITDSDHSAYNRQRPASNQLLHAFAGTANSSRFSFLRVRSAVLGIRNQRSRN